MKTVRGVLTVFCGLAAMVTLCGCLDLQSPAEYITGETGDLSVLADEAAVDVVSPQSDLAITGGTPVEVNWRVVARTRYSVVDVYLDVDTDPDNDNEIIAYSNLAISETTQTLDTTALSAGTYLIGVRVEEVGEIVASDYAPGRLIVNQRPGLYFTSPRDNFVYDRTIRINPSFDVAWSLDDPDSTVTVQIYLDPDETPNGNEVLLRTSTSQTGDSFTFNLPTASFEAGTYRLLALVSDGVDTFSYYAPGSIRLRARLAGYVDLRNMHLPSSEVSGAVFEGFNPRDNAGSFVSSIHDIDQDGFDDFIVLAQFGKPDYESNEQRTGVGEAYLIYGRNESFSGLVNLNSVGTLFRGDIFTGVPEVTDPLRPSRGITSFALLTDWDRDGIRELAFGLPYTDSLSTGWALDPSGYFRSGAVVIACGASLRPDLGFPGRNTLNLAEFGTVPHVAYTDPVCAEGFVGPKYSATGGAGPGGSTSFHKHIYDPADPRNGGFVMGCRLSTHEANDEFGETISAWDFHSIIMSSPGRDPSVCVSGADVANGAGVISVYFCHVYYPFFPWNTDNMPPANSEYGFDYAGAPGNHIESNWLPHGGPYHYVMDDIRFLDFGRASPGYTVDPDDATDPCTAEVAGGISTPSHSTRFWSSVPGARLNNAKALGDVNADGLLDLVIGAPFADDGAGACYIVLGRLRSLIQGGQLQLEELALPMNGPDSSQERIFNGIRVVGSPNERLGQSQDDAGDFNNDGLADVLIGSPLLNGRQGGAAVFFGSRDAINLTQEEIPFTELPERGLGVIFVGEEYGDLAGARVATAGDVNGDGNDDILIAAPNRSVRLDGDLDGTVEIDRTECGVVYLIYGSPDLTGTISLSLIGTEQLPGAVFIGRNSQDQLGAGLGEHGDRSFGIASGGDVNGDGFGDILLGSVTASPRDCARAGEAYLLYGAGD